MTDPREGKLPKWAQELIEDERLKSVLAWPDFEKPERVAHIDINGFGGNFLQAGSIVWSFSTFNHSVTDHTIGGARLRGVGDVFASKQEALDAKAWAVCLACARQIKTANEERE